MFFEREQQFNFDFYKPIYNLEIYQDDIAESPRNWDNLGAFLVHSDKYVDDEAKKQYQILEDWEFTEYKKDQKKLEKLGFIAFPVSVYDHSGVSIFPGFSSGWDLGCIGFYVVSKERIKKEYGVKKVFANIKKKVLDIMELEIKTLDAFFNSEIFGFSVKDEKGEEVDNCGGFYRTDYDNNRLFDSIKSYLPEEITRQQFDSAIKNIKY